MEITRPTVMEISLKNFQYNIEQIRKLTSNAKLMPVVKANGYGTYINKNLEYKLILPNSLIIGSLSTSIIWYDILLSFKVFSTLFNVVSGKPHTSPFNTL